MGKPRPVTTYWTRTASSLWMTNFILFTNILEKSQLSIVIPLRHQTIWTRTRSPIPVLTEPDVGKLRWSSPTCYHYQQRHQNVRKMRRLLFNSNKHLLIPCSVQSGPEKNAQTFMHRHFATVCSSILQFSSKCPQKITVYHSMQNLYQFVKYSLKKTNRTGYILWATSRCMWTWHLWQLKMDCLISYE